MAEDAWIMKGMDWNDPYRILTWQELVNWVNEVGFLPLFAVLGTVLLYENIKHVKVHGTNVLAPQWPLNKEAHHDRKRTKKNDNKPLNKEVN